VRSRSDEDRQEPRDGEEDESQDWEMPWDWMSRRGPRERRSGKAPWEWEGPWPHKPPEHWGPSMAWPDWHHRHRDFYRWRKKMRRKRGGVFFRFVGAFGCLTMLILGGMAGLGFLLSQLFEGSGRMAMTLWFGGCGLVFGLAMLAGLLARRTFRDIATPLADVMTAADAVAEGDLSVRVEEDKPGEFGQLARSFNRMIERLEQSDQQRRNLTADVAHELRTPLHIIQGNLEGVLDGVYEPTADHVGATLEEARQLSRLVEDLRTLSLAEAGQLPLIKEPVDVAELLADVCTSFSGQAEAAGIDLCVKTGGDLPAITGDVGRLDQVLGNLVANAVRHTPEGGRIILRAVPRKDGVRILVRDTGEGIPAEDLPHIFDRFWKGDRSRTRAGGAGSGLGLAIARQLVQAHGGTIGVESTVGRGTTFIIDLPGE
jgi:signal transduction histidine kinase